MVHIVELNTKCEYPASGGPRGSMSTLEGVGPRFRPRARRACFITCGEL